ncbi:Na/Pi cotransporter family protein [Desulforamulus hydrothermalis]|uniref:Na/Pi-cotransporter II-related protein n=1 Tax=Desulforamulus hydrothermalis Lam5 = DSM 18033 TaxID=1121428 RepID=K8DXQ4_9FIRM|nr:Na/Pi cotransporter family protein [Desulforamulus hydrothermalis]CCO07389.1 Na/Pi-cotransporter II-related protein [Desulforamulus hydrothermalis Lam5 = DSM 18033]SHH41371.1 phosphate:Na+ symporter [Desulforamulus hydrothermalis Lam5 = DSM 18033]
MHWNVVVLNMIGGVGLLLYGMSLMKENLQKVAGRKLRQVLMLLTKNRFVGVLLGTLITLLFQSSTATTVLLIGLTSASIISLRETLAVVLGADIGSTITAQLIALKATEISLPVIFIGSFMFIMAKSNRKKRMALALIGFGILFLGLKIMCDTMSPLKTDPTISKTLTQISSYPWLGIIGAAVFTFLISSSAAAIGIIMLLAIQHMISLETAVYMLLGANIGTTFTPMLSSLGASRESQRVALAHFLFKTTGVLVFLPFMEQIVCLMVYVTDAPGFQVANTHTFFNIVITLLFLPFLKHCAYFLEIVLPDKNQGGHIKPKYLEDNFLPSPELAIGMASKEIMNISDYVIDMIKPVYTLFACYDQEKADKILEEEEKVDLLAMATNNYLTKLMRTPLTREEFNKTLGLLNIVREYEFVGDIVERNVIGMAERMNMKNLEFSTMGQREIFALHQKVVQMIYLVNTALATNSCLLAEKAKILQEEIVDLQFRLQMSHLARIQKGGIKTDNLTFIYMSLLDCYLKISEHMKNIAAVLTNDLSCVWPEEKLQPSYN